MCPICLTNAALIAAGATSSGGLTAFVMGKFYREKSKPNQRKQNETERDGTRNGSE
jgi:membrane protein YqaA with SNARE-associated domain